MNKIKVSAVSYTNSIPFVLGIKSSNVVLEQIELSLDIPSDCATKLAEGKVDIGLVPVAIIPQISNAEIIGDYCIGSDGAVDSVFIFSHVPIEDVKTLCLDNHSRTSNNLAKVLLKNYWKLQPNFIKDEEGEWDARVLIGDRTFGKKGDYAYVYDLGEYWKKFTGLPFVYAAWVSTKQLNPEFIFQFNEALKFGLNKRKEVINQIPVRSDFDYDDYLMNKLDFDLNAEKRKALNLFLEYISKLDQ